MRISLLLQTAKQQIDSLDAEILACHVFNISPAQLITKAEIEVLKEQKDKFIRLVQQRKNGHSISEILGEKEFYGKIFSVTNDVLTPRPETEVLVETALEYIEQNNISRIIDIGTGSGCIAVSLAHLTNKTIEVIASDVSHKAITVAKKNTEHILQNSKSVQFIQSNLLENIPTEKIKNACIVTNLPYIPSTDILEKEVLNGDPLLALFSGSNGTDLYTSLFQTLPNTFLALFFEFHPPQKEYFEALLQKLYPNKSVSFFSDLSGDVRFGKIV